MKKHLKIYLYVVLLFGLVIVFPISGYAAEEDCGLSFDQENMFENTEAVEKFDEKQDINIGVTDENDGTVMGEEQNINEEIIENAEPEISEDSSIQLEREETEQIILDWKDSDLGKQYLDENGEPLTGMQLINGKYYMLDEEGFLQYGLLEYNGELYYADATTGVIKKEAGWIENEGKRYFSNEDGVLYKNSFISFGRTYYYMGADGSVQMGMIKTANGELYYADATTGVIKKEAGFVEWNGGRYYVKQGGALYRNQFIHSVDANGLKKYYYVGNDGKVFIGEFTIGGVAYTTSENGVINENVVLQGTKGIDVSEWNGTIDWAKVKAAGIDFAFIRVGGRYYGSGGMYGDSTFVKNIRNAIAAGIKVGVYYFTQAINTEEAIEEAVYTINQIRGYGLSLPVVIDTEATPDGRHNNISVATRTNVIKAFCDKIQSSGYTPMIYGSTSWLNDKLNMNELSNYLVWVAQYYYKCEYEGEYQCWQYTSSGRVNGVNGNVDMNYWYGASDSLIVE